MTKPTQDEFETAQEVLDFMIEYIRENETHAFTAIEDLESVLSSNSFNECDYD